jgi:biopolymer transport protein ExbD
MKTVFPNRKTKSPELRMTPMIDVIFLLLVFFVCTASFVPPEGMLPTNLSQSGSTVEIILPKPEQLDIVRILLTFDQTPHWKVEGNLCRSLQEVRQILNKLCELRQDIPVIIDSEETVPMEHVIDVYDSCRAAGLSKIQFAAKSNTKSKSKSKSAGNKN